MVEQNYCANNVTVIIRGVGERTEGLCREIVGMQFPQQNIFQVREQPFFRAVQKTFQIGIAKKRTWTLAVDADTLLVPGVVLQLCKSAELQGTQLFKAQGLIIDKFLSSPRPAGPHLYRTEHLPEALRHIADSAEDIRPETFVLKMMKRQSYGLLQANIVTGFHDFEQYYRDIFKKSFLHAKKHALPVEWIKSQWEQLAGSDYDYALAMAGYESGRRHRGTFVVDTDSVPMQDFSRVMHDLNIEDKLPMAAAESCIARISQQVGALLGVKDREAVNMKTSYSYRLGRAATWPLRKIINFYAQSNDENRFPDK